MPLTITEAEKKLAALEALRNEPHDQTMRCETIRIIYGPGTSALNETRRFLEAEIRRMRERIRFFYAEQIHYE